MAILDQARPTRTVPFGMDGVDRAPKQRYYDEGFYRLERDDLWLRVWQMACRLEEIPEPFDFVEYEFLDQSVVVVRTEDGGARAFQNACRHRGVRVAQGRGTCASGFTCPFHGWCYAPDGTNTAVTRKRTFSARNLQPGDLDLVPVQCETWGGLAWINLDPAAPPLRECIEPFATTMDAWRLESLRAEWWYACRLPVNWKLAIEGFIEQYHVLEAHPQLRIPARMLPRSADGFDAAAWREGELRYLRTMSEGMAGMVHAHDVRLAEGLRDLALPAEPREAAAAWQRALNDAVAGWHRGRGADIPDLNGLADRGIGDSMYHCFPHFLVLPMYSSASSYRFRPLGPEETLMEIWSLTRFPPGEEPARPAPPEVWAHDDPRWPPIPAQDFANLPRQQTGLHAQGFEYMRLSEGAEGGISNFERVIDGFLAGQPWERLLPALRQVNVNPLEQPVADLGW